MRLSVFKRWQEESKDPFMCFNSDHSMPLVPFMNENLIVELKCFVNGCNYKYIPGLLKYEEIQDRLMNV